MTEDVWVLVKISGCALAAVLIWYAVFRQCRRFDDAAASVASRAVDDRNPQRRIMPYRLTLIVDFPNEPSKQARADMVASLREFKEAVDYLGPTIVTQKLVKARSIDRQRERAGPRGAGSIVLRGMFD